MADPFVGEIRMFAGNFAPAGWAFCDGSLLPIAQNDVLFTLLGTTYGGDGQTTFALPDLRGRVPVHQDPALALGQQAGSETVTLTAAQLPAHTHALMATTQPAVATAGPTGVLAASSALKFYGSNPGGPALAASALGTTSGGQPHDNMAPFTAVSFIIALFGIYPSQS